MVDVKQRNDRIRTLEEENARLRAHVTRLQNAVRHMAAEIDGDPFTPLTGSELQHICLQPGDLDPVEGGE